VDHGYPPVRQRLLLLLVFALVVGSGIPGTSVARTPSAPPSAGPAASREPADCGPVAATLPGAIAGQPAQVTITQGVAAIDPDELLDPWLAVLGRSRGDVCLVAFRYGDGHDAIAGQLLRVAGADADTNDLGGDLAAALRDRLVSYGAQATLSLVDVDGDPVWRLAITADGQPSDVLVYQLGDTLLMTFGLDSMGLMLAALRPAGSPAPSPLTVPGSPVG
jgi:hypothetical protein